MHHSLHHSFCDSLMCVTRITHRAPTCGIYYIPAASSSKHGSSINTLSALTHTQSAYLRRTHNLELVVSSWNYQEAFDVSKTLEDAIENGDGMATSLDEASKAYNSGRGREQQQPAEAAAAAAGAPGQQQQPLLSQAASAQAAVTSKLFEAYAAASGAAAAAASPLASAAGSIYAGLSSLPIPSLGGGGSEGAPGSSSSGGGSKRPSLSQAVMVGSRAASAVIAESRLGSHAGASGSGRSSSEPDGLSLSTSVSSECPSEWFVCDDPVRNLRIFVIQGSDSIDHWKLNLTFDPVTFEDPELGVTVSQHQPAGAQGGCGMCRAESDGESY